MAFHLGCLRALHDCGVLEKINVLSSVSGGSVIAALYAYHDEPFEDFEKRVERALLRGMIWGIAREMFLSTEALKILLTIFTAGGAALLGRVVQIMALPLRWLNIGGAALSRFLGHLAAPIPRFASRTTAFERHLARTYFGDKLLPEVKRKELTVVINAAELTTETAFRFGSVESGCWRFGRLTQVPKVATAVAASAAFPAFLPAIDRRMEFEKDGATSSSRVMITDGGVYDNLGISCILPGRSSEFSTNAFPVDWIIVCDAGPGMPPGTRRPYFVGHRMLATISTIHRRTQTLSQNVLHRMAAAGEIKGFVMPYLGMLDSRLPAAPADLVPREAVADYPTDFNPMSRDDIANLSGRGEQLTRTLVATYAKDL